MISHLMSCRHMLKKKETFQLWYGLKHIVNLNCLWFITDIIIFMIPLFFIISPYNAIVTQLGDVVQQKKSQVLIHLDLLFSTLTLKMLHKLQANELK
jgi:hypothetical protein